VEGLSLWISIDGFINRVHGSKVANPVYLSSAWQTLKSWYTVISSEVGRGDLISKKDGRFAGPCSTPAGVA